MSSYPNSIKTFTTKIDNIDVIQAAHVNDIQAEITAIEAELGTLPKGSYATVKDRLEALSAQIVRPNLLTNGNFIVSQRIPEVGASSLVSPGGNKSFVADRWKVFRSSLAGGYVHSRWETGDEGFPYRVFVSRSPGDTIMNFLRLEQDLESIDSIPLQGKYLTLTFRFQRGSGADGVFNAKILGGTGTDAWLGGTSFSTLGDLVFTPTTSPTTFTVTTSQPISSSIKQIGVMFTYTPSQSVAPENDGFSVYGVKLEEGNLFTGWEFSNFADTLRQCKRYYEKSCRYSVRPIDGLDRHDYFASSYGASTVIRARVEMEVEKRVRPTVIFRRTTDGTVDGQAAYYLGAWTSSTNTIVEFNNAKSFTMQVAGSGFTGGNTYQVSVGWEADAEL